MKSAIHYSNETDSYLAGREAISAILEKMAGDTPDLLLLFSSVGHDLPEVILGIESYCAEVPLCGCSGAGVISASGSDEATHSIALMGITDKNISIAPFIYSGLFDDPEGVGRQIATHLRNANIRSEQSALLLLFADGLTINADALYRGIRQGFPYHVDVVGGTAGNDFQQDKTYQFCNGRVVEDGACGVLLSGDFHYCIGVTHGSTPIGLFRTISRAEGNVICEIDNVPALDVLKDLIGVDRVQDIGQTLNLFELGEEFPGQGYSQNILNRAIIGIDEDIGGIRLAVEIPEGTRVRITRRDRGLVLQRTQEMADAMISELRDWETATYLYFNCSGRGSYLFGDPKPDVDVIRNVLTERSNMVGFFTFGEFAPINSCNYFHNYTGVLLGIEG